MDGYVAEVRLFGGNFAPRNWALCQGQLMPIAQNTALFSLLGTTYGGNGQTTFALPDLKGRLALHPGQGPGLSAYALGQSGGSETVTILAANLPAHTHGVTGSATMNATAADGDQDSPQNTYPAAMAGTDMYVTSHNGSLMGAMQNNFTSGNTGQGSPSNNRQPVLALNFIICLSGIFPARN